MLINGDQRLGRSTVREIAEDCNISVGPCHEILVEKLELHRAAAKWLSLG